MLREEFNEGELRQIIDKIKIVKEEGKESPKEGGESKVAASSQKGKGGTVKRRLGFK